MNRMFGWDYPPGVTGMEPEIAGYPNCAVCGHEVEEHEDVDKGTIVCHGEETGTNNEVLHCNCGEYVMDPEPVYPYDTKRERDEP